VIARADDLRARRHLQPACVVVTGALPVMLA
jgi:hypothetical protein